MDEWLSNLPIFWMVLIVFIFTYLLSLGIYLLVMMLAKGKHTDAFKSISAGMLPPLGILFGLFVAFTAAQVWDDTEKAHSAVDREASALRSVVVLTTIFSGEAQIQMRTLVRNHIQQIVAQEWPMMAHGTATLRFTPPLLSDALKLTLSLTPQSEGQKIAQQEMVSALESAYDARRQRIIISQSQVNMVKWFCLIIQAVAALFAIAMIHCGNRASAMIAMGLFGTGVAAAILLIAAHDRPFSGAISIRPGPLLQVVPENESSSFTKT